jgi:hypothetical protein
MSLVLHAIILHKPIRKGTKSPQYRLTQGQGPSRQPKFKSKEQSLLYALDHFPKEKIKGFVRETESSFRVRVVPKTKFIKTSYVSKVINPNMTIVLGKLKSIPI